MQQLFILHISHPLVLALYICSFIAALAPAKAHAARLASRWLLVSGLVCQGAMILLRWNAENHFPVTGLFETLHFLAFCVAAITLYFDIRYHAREFLPGALLLVLLAVGMASLGPKKPFPLTPSLDTPLFFIHVATSFAAYGLWGAAAILGIYDLSGRSETLKVRWRRMQDESVYIGYILFTWCILAGSLWAYLAWGSYWTWKIKGLWSYLLWFYYSGVIHVRRNPRWQGWPADILALAGFVLVLFTYLGLGVFFKTNHPLL